MPGLELLKKKSYDAQEQAKQALGRDGVGAALEGRPWPPDQRAWIFPIGQLVSILQASCSSGEHIKASTKTIEQIGISTDVWVVDKIQICLKELLKLVISLDIFSINRH